MKLYNAKRVERTLRTRQNMSCMRDEDHLSRVLEEELKCPVCLEEFVEPKSLSCSHTVCRECLSNMVRHTSLEQRGLPVRCPTCRSRTDISFPGGVDSLPTSYIVTTLISGKDRTKEIKELEERLKRGKQALQVRQELTDEIVDMSESLSQRRQEVEGDIRQTAERIVQMVRASEETLIQDLNLKVASQQRELRLKREVMQSSISRANDMFNNIEEQLNTLPTRRLIQEKSSIASKLTDIDTIELELEIPEVADIAFIPNTTITASDHLLTLGRLEIGHHHESSPLRLAVPDYTSDPVQISSFGVAGTNRGEFMLPWGVAICDDGCIAVADHANNRIQLFDNQGAFLKSVPDGESEKITLPTGIDFDLDHNIVTFDSKKHELQVVDSMGQLIRKIGNERDLGDRVEGISIDSEGRIIVTDSSHERVLVYHYSGHLCLKFGADGENRLGRPSCAVFHHGQFIVSDTFNHCLKVYNRHGVFLRKIGRPGKEAGQFRQPKGLAVDSASNILVCDFGNCRVQVLDFDGNFIKSFGTFGDEEGEFWFPYSIAVGKEGEVVVSDCNNNRMQIFRFPLQEVSQE